MTEVQPPLSERETAFKLGIGLKALRNLRSVGRGPNYMRVGRYIRYRSSEVERWMQDQTITTDGN